MKLAITAQGGTSDSPVDQRFGRAEWLLIHDTESSDWKALENNDPAQGAGLKVAEMLANQGVENVITGHCGPKAFKALQAAGIGVYLVAEGTASEAVNRFQAGELKPASQPDVESHWS